MRTFKDCSSSKRVPSILRLDHLSIKQSLEALILRVKVVQLAEKIMCRSALLWIVLRKTQGEHQWK